MSSAFCRAFLFLISLICLLAEAPYAPAQSTYTAHNMDVTFGKQFTIHEGMTLQLRGEFFNFTNSIRFGFPNLAWAPGQPGVDNTTFGQVTYLANSPRTAQFGMRFQF